jgi:hypothetical protein
MSLPVQTAPRAAAYIYKVSTLFSAILLLLGLAFCGGGDNVGPGDRNVVASVTISPDGLTLPVGGTASLTADVRDTAGAPMANSSVVWTSQSNGIATVSSSGSVSGISPGFTQVIAAAGDKADTVAVLVTDPSSLPATLLLKVNSRLTRTTALPPIGESFEGYQVIGEIPLTFNGTSYVGEGPLPFGGSGFEYRPLLAPCTVWTQTTEPGPVTAAAELRTGNTLADAASLSLSLGQQQPGTDGSGTLTAGPGCPPISTTVPLPNSFFAFFLAFHLGPIQGWQPGVGEPFATYSTTTSREEPGGVTLTEDTRLELFTATP